MANKEFFARKGLVSLGGITYPYVTTGISYSITDDDYFIEGQNPSITITLPAASLTGKGKIYVIKNSSSGDITISPASGSIEGSPSYTLSSGLAITCNSDGTNWV